MICSNSGGSCKGSPVILHKLRVPSLSQVGDFVLYGDQKYDVKHRCFNLPLKKFPTSELVRFTGWYEKYRPKNKNMVIFRFEYYVMRIELLRRKQRCVKNHSTC